MGRLSGVPSPLRAPRSPSSAPAAQPGGLGGVRRGSARERGYDARWDRASRLFLAENPLCRGCGEAATLTDHTIPHRGDKALFWDPDNWQPGCDWCHSAVKQKLEAKFDAGLIGAGDLRLDSPAARSEAAAARAAPKSAR